MTIPITAATRRSAASNMSAHEPGTANVSSAYRDLGHRPARASQPFARGGGARFDPIWGSFGSMREAAGRAATRIIGGGRSLPQPQECWHAWHQQFPSTGGGPGYVEREGTETSLNYCGPAGEYSTEVPQRRPGGPPYVCSDRYRATCAGCWQGRGFESLLRCLQACYLGKFSPLGICDICRLVVTRLVRRVSRAVTVAVVAGRLRARPRHPRSTPGTRAGHRAVRLRTLLRAPGPVLAR
jgi:hypothetical protein